ncbi:MAG: signal peptidase II [Nanoarchaeota archaeon]
MKRMKPKETLIYSVVFVILVLLDQLVKDFFLKTNAYYDLGFFALHLVTNTGASFGMLKPYNIVLLVLSVIVLAGIFLYFRRVMPNARPYLLLIAAGTMGNLLNRMAYGFVVDFIDFRFFPVFNFADMFIFFGIVGFGILLLREK